MSQKVIIMLYPKRVITDAKSCAKFGASALSERWSLEQTSQPNRKLKKP